MPRVRDLSARRKLMLAFALAAMASVAVGVGALRALAQVRARADVARRDEAVNDARDAALIGMQQTSIAIRDDLLAEDAAQQAAAKARRVEASTRLFAALDRALATTSSGREKAALLRVIDLRTQIKVSDAGQRRVDRGDVRHRAGAQRPGRAPARHGRGVPHRRGRPHARDDPG